MTRSCQPCSSGLGTFQIIDAHRILHWQGRNASRWSFDAASKSGRCCIEVGALITEFLVDLEMKK